MPITGPASYISTIDEFLAHWAAANTALGVGAPVEVLGGVTAAALLGLRGQLETVRFEVEAVRNTREGTRFTLDALKAALLARLNQFNLKLRSLSPDTKWEASLPKAFTASEGMGRVIPPLDDVASLWQMYEDEETAFTLMGGYTRAMFVNDLAGLKVTATALTNADKALGLKRGARTELEQKIQPILKAYRQRIPAEFPEGSAILNTLPRLTPLAGSTPDPVVVNGNFNPATLTADLNWTASTNADIAAYEVRGVAGPDYDPEDETILASIPPNNPRALSTAFALSTPGNNASYKVYVITTAGNERGSNALTVARPG